MSRWPINFAGESRFGSWRINETRNERPARKHHAIVIYGNCYCRCMYIYTGIHIQLIDDVKWCLLMPYEFMPNQSESCYITTDTSHPHGPALLVFPGSGRKLDFGPNPIMIPGIHGYFSIIITVSLLLPGWWCTYPSEKYDIVNGRIILYIMENKIHVWNHQQVTIIIIQILYCCPKK